VSRLLTIVGIAAFASTLYAGGSAASRTAASGDRIAFVSGLGLGRLALVDARGGPVRFLTRARDVSEFEWSPDGTRIVFVREITVGYDRDEPVRQPALFLVGSDGSGLRRLSPRGVRDEDPEWSPDGRRIVFTRTGDLVDGLGNDIWVMNADGSGTRRLTRHPVLDREATWSPDGRSIAWVRSWPAAVHVFVMNADGTRQHRLLRAKLETTSPAWSPDGRLLAVTGFHTKKVYTVRPDGSAIVEVVRRADFDTEVDWAPDGARIAYSAESVVRVVTVRGGRSGAPRRIHSGYAVDWSPDGRRLALDDLVGGAGVGVFVLSDTGRGARLVARGGEPAWRP
jgi:TolB protein